jgi:hypothetical protein
MLSRVKHITHRFTSNVVLAHAVLITLFSLSMVMSMPSLG